MKTIEEIRKGYECPRCKSQKDLAFQAMHAYCYKCNGYFDLGTKF